MRGLHHTAGPRRPHQSPPQAADLARSDAGEALRILAANVGGLIPWITAIATPERLARPGRLWVFSSVAADRGRPSNYHYGAAKAALELLCSRSRFSIRAALSVRSS